MTHDALLPRAKPVNVAAELLASRDEEPVESLEEVERAWAAEIERRARRVLSGGAAGRTWAEVKDRIERRLAE
ncbi:MAG TPA: addiction module protein [Thermoanaerobaculia bacterium]|nr:addiction module protein [Thermoanaerobaculia bacterium]